MDVYLDRPEDEQERFRELSNGSVYSKKAFGYRSCEALEIALYHTLGNLPEPEFTHRFC